MSVHENEGSPLHKGDIVRITIAQLDVSYKNKKKNISNLRNQLSKIKNPGEIILLPELFTTGYVFEKPAEMHRLAEVENDSVSLQELLSIAAEFDVIIVCGIAEKEGDSYFNSVVILDRGGVINKYRKISQTNIDKQYFSRGDETVTFECSGVTFGVIICFDIWFPEIVRKYTKLGVDILLHPANFGGEQSFHIARACAIENDMTVVTCNRVGEEVTKEIVATYCGKSQVVDPSGTVTYQAGSSAEISTVNIDFSKSVEKKIIGVELSSEIEAINNCLQ